MRLQSIRIQSKTGINKRPFANATKSAFLQNYRILSQQVQGVLVVQQVSTGETGFELGHTFAVDAVAERGAEEERSGDADRPVFGQKWQYFGGRVEELFSVVFEELERPGFQFFSQRGTEHKKLNIQIF